MNIWRNSVNSEILVHSNTHTFDRNLDYQNGRNIVPV